jgi:signal peptidase
MTKLVARNVTLAALCIALLVPAALIATGRAGYRVFIVSTGSMMPSISPNSVAIVERGVYRVGQTISFMTASGVVTHRLLERRADGSLVTKGDANATADPGTVSPEDVIGGVIAAPPLMGYLLIYLKDPLGVASLLLAIVCVWLGGSLADQRKGQRSARA